MQQLQEDNSFVGVSVSNLKTPAFLVSRKQVEANCRLLQAVAAERGLHIRPHMKTHKTIEVGRYQVAGLREEERRIIVSTLMEAHFFAGAGFNDILYATPIPPQKLAEASALTQKVPRFHILIDTKEALAAVLEYSRLNSNTHKKKWSVFLKVDCGYHRHGTDPFDPESLTLAEQLAKVHQDFVEFAGIYSHSGHSYTGKTDEEIMNVAKSECQVMTKFVNFLESEKGITPPVVSVGATPSCTHLPEKEDLGRVTEIHPGNYVFFDRSQYELGSCKEEEVSAWVMCRVVAHYPARHTFAIDAGALAFSKDEGPIHLHTNDICGYGLIKGHPELRIVKVTQEIGLVKYPQHDSGKNYSQEFGLGKLIFVLPNHSCLTAALYDKYFVVEKFDDNLERFADNEKVIGVWRPCRGW